MDSATAIILGLFFAWEGVKMIRWASNKKFTGGCCEDCADPPPRGDAELGTVYRDICGCCAEKEACRSADECKCTIAKDNKTVSIVPFLNNLWTES